MGYWIDNKNKCKLYKKSQHMKKILSLSELSLRFTISNRKQTEIPGNAENS